MSATLTTMEGSMSSELTHDTPRPHTEDMTATAAPATARDTFDSLHYNVFTMIEKIDKLNARAAKKGLEGGASYTTSTTVVKHPERNIDIQVTVLEIAYTPVKANGWTLVAAVDWVGDKPIVNTVPGYEGPLVDRATLDGHCDHCGTDRLRSHVIVCEHPVEGRKVVGGQCVKDLLGHTYSSLISVKVEPVIADEDRESRGSSAPVSYRTLDIVIAAIAATRVWGWVGSKAAEELGKTPTSSYVARIVARGTRWMINQERRNKRPNFKMIAQIEEAQALIEDPATEAQALQVIEWAKGLDENRSEFNANLVTLATSEYVDMYGKGRVGTLTYAPTGYARFLETAAERAAKQAAREAAQANKPAVNNTPLGQPKDKVEFEATITGVKFLDGDYGTTTLVKFLTTTSQKVAWFASSTVIDETWVGSQVSVKATVKGTSEFNGEIETRILRAKVTKH